MAAHRPYSQGVSIVVIGGFNPRIFEPLWLSSHDLVAEAEASGAERELIDKEFARIVLPWATLIAMAERLQVTTEGEITNPSQIRDLVVGILRLLPHTPITIISINHWIQTQLASEEEWHTAGDRLAPKEAWQGILDQPGMLDFAMQGARPDDLTGAIKVRVQPSRMVHPGLFININDEFSMSDHHDFEPARHAADLLEQVWPDAEKRVESIHSSLLERLIH